MDVPTIRGHFIYGLDGKKFCNCITDEEGNVVFETKNSKILPQDLLAQAFGSKAPDYTRDKRDRRDR